jgi:hypothetical protein
VLVDAGSLLQALRLPETSSVDAEPHGLGVERWTLCAPGAEQRVVVVRAHPEPELAANHAAVVEALSRAGFTRMPPPLALVGDAVVEPEIPGVTALALVPPARSLEAAMGAIAALHSLDVREGLRWEQSPEMVLPSEWPLHRLGFAAHERDAATTALHSARDAILISPWGFTHGDCTAAHVLLAPGHAELTSFHAAGFGPQLFDVAAFLLTAGIEADARSYLATIYAAQRDLDPRGTADLVDLASILWGIGELLVLPRRSIELLGDDAALSALNLGAGRIERGIREPAGDHPAARAIRAALWPS